MILFISLRKLSNSDKKISEALSGLIKTLVYLLCNDKLHFNRFILLNETELAVSDADLRAIDFSSYNFKFSYGANGIFYYSPVNVRSELTKMFQTALVIRFNKTEMKKLNKQLQGCEILVNALDYITNPEEFSVLKLKSKFFIVQKYEEGYPEEGWSNNIHIIDDIKQFYEINNVFQTYKIKDRVRQYGVLRRYRDNEMGDYNYFERYEDLYYYMFYQLYPEIVEVLDREVHTHNEFIFKGRPYPKGMRLLIVYEEYFFAENLVRLIYHQTKQNFQEFDAENDLIKFGTYENLLIHNIHKCQENKSDKIIYDIKNDRRQNIIILSKSNDPHQLIFKRLKNADFVPLFIPSLQNKPKPISQLLVFIFASFHKSLFFRGPIFYTKDFDELLSGIGVDHFDILYETISEISQSHYCVALNHPLFWYYFKVTFNRIQMQKKEREQNLELVKNYTIEKHRSTWFINYGYSEPLYLQDLLGLYYICYVLKNKKRIPIDIVEIFNEVREDIDKSKKKKRYTQAEVTKMKNSMAKAIDEAKDKLKKYEEDNGIEHNLLSNYLVPLRVNKSISKVEFHESKEIDWAIKEIYKKQ